MSQSAKLATLAVRSSALYIICLGIWQLLGNVADTFRDIDPSYISYYFQSQLARPLLGMLTGCVMWLLSRPLGRLVARGLDNDVKNQQ